MIKRTERIRHLLLTNCLYVFGATKLYFTYYLRVVSILLSTGSYKSAFSTYYFDKTRFLSFMFLYRWFLIFSFPLF